MKLFVSTALAVGLVLSVGSVALARRRTPEAAEPYFVYTIQEGDTLSALAKRFFGDADKWQVLLDAMPAKPQDPHKALPIGAVIQVPCVWVTVQKGDSLAKIAKRVLDDGGRYGRIVAANKKALPNPNKLAVGQRLAVPLVAASTSGAEPTAA